MSHPEGEGAQSGAEGTQSGAGETTGNGGENSGSQTESTGSSAQSGATEETVSKADLLKQQDRTRAADERAARAEAALKQLRDKDLPEAEKLKRDYEEAQTQVKTLTERNTKLALENAFLKDNTYTWQNPARALQLIDLSQVEIDAEGSVTGLKEALKALATSDPYLIKKEAEGTGNTPPPTSSGGNGGSSSGKPSTKGLAARIPALNTRVRRS